MQQYYQPMYQQARDLQYRIHDMVANSSHPTAQVLRTEAQKLAEEIEMDKPPRDVEERIHIIQRQLEEQQHSAARFMDAQHAADLHRTYEHMRLDVRNLPHYY